MLVGFGMRTVLLKLTPNVELSEGLARFFEPMILTLLARVDRSRRA